MPFKDLDQQREYARNWIRKRRDSWFNGKSCVHCGATEQLELDHIDPLIKVSHTVWSWSEAKRNEELTKCQPLCNSCHKIKTREQSIAPHGVVSRYENRGCRCEECKLAKRIKNAKRSKRESS